MSTSSVDNESVRLVVDVWAIGDVIVAVGLTDALKHCRSKGKEAQYVSISLSLRIVSQPANGRIFANEVEGPKQTQMGATVHVVLPIHCSGAVHVHGVWVHSASTPS